MYLNYIMYSLIGKVLGWVFVITAIVVSVNLFGGWAFWFWVFVGIYYLVEHDTTNPNLTA